MKLSKEQFDKLAEAIGRASYNASDGAMRFGYEGGTILTLKTLGYEFDQEALRRAITEVDNRIYEEKNRELDTD